MAFTDGSKFIWTSCITSVLCLVQNFTCAQRSNRLYLSVQSLPKEGNLLKLNCQFLLSSSRLEKSNLSFVRDGGILTSNDLIVDEELKNRTGVELYFYGDIPMATFEFPAMRTDSGYYECCLLDGNSLKNYSLKLCGGKAISIVYFSEIYPICMPSEKVFLYPGTKQTTMSLSCTSELGNPNVTLQWTKEGDGNMSAMSSKIVSSENGFVISNLSLSLAHMDIDGLYVCTASNRYYNRRCSISVRTIIVPYLSLHPVEAVAEVNQDVKLTCSFLHLVNYTTKWEWHSKPPLNASRMSASDNVLIISNVSMVDNETSISCLALFESQWFQAYTVLYVREAKEPCLTANGERFWSKEEVLIMSTLGIALIATIAIVSVLALKLYKITTHDTQETGDKGDK